MFALQAGAIRNALVQAGMPMRVAQQLASVLSNTAAEYRTGRITQDTTPDNLQYVDSEARKHQLTGIDPLADDPDFRARQQAETEERRKAEQPSPIAAVASVYSRPSGEDVEIAGGAYTSVALQGQAKTVGLRVAGAGSYPTLDSRSNTVIAKSFRFEVGNEDLDKLRGTIEEAGGEVVWKAQLVNLTPITVVTVEGNKGGAPVYGTRRLYAWSDATFGDNGNGGPPGGTDAGTNVTVVTGLQWTGTALVGSYANVKVSAVNGGGSGTIVGATECQ